MTKSSQLDHIQICQDNNLLKPGHSGQPDDQLVQGQHPHPQCQLDAGILLLVLHAKPYKTPQNAYKNITTSTSQLDAIG